MPWDLDMPWLLHLLGTSDLRCGDDMRQPHVHVRTNVYSTVVDMFIYANLSIVSVMRGDSDLRSRDFDLCGIIDVPGINDLRRDHHVRTASSHYRKLPNLPRIWKLRWRAVMRCRSDVSAEH